MSNWTKVVHKCDAPRGNIVREYAPGSEWTCPSCLSLWVVAGTSTMADLVRQTFEEACN